MIYQQEPKPTSRAFIALTFAAKVLTIIATGSLLAAALWLLHLAFFINR